MTAVTEREAALQYILYEIKLPGLQYAISNKSIAKYANIRPGHVVISIGEGTGSTAHQLYSNVGKSGKYIAVEPSPVMAGWTAMYFAHPSVKIATYSPDTSDWKLADNTNIVIGKAEELSELLPTVKADRVVLANSMHWTNRPDALKQINKIIHPNGRLVFNLSSTNYSFDKKGKKLFITHPLRKLFFQALERKLKEEHKIEVKLWTAPKPSTLNRKQVEKELNEAGFKLEHYDESYYSPVTHAGIIASLKTGGMLTFYQNPNERLRAIPDSKKNKLINDALAEAKRKLGQTKLRKAQKIVLYERSAIFVARLA